MSHLLEYIDIKDFKCFKDFHAEGFKRVNLIGGKNNVGKTAFMEACYINVHASDVIRMFTAITDIKFRREKLEVLNKIFKNDKSVELFENTFQYDSRSNIRDVGYKLLNSNGIKEYEFRHQDEINTINSNDFSYELIRYLNVTFLDAIGLTNEEIKNYYVEVQKKDKEDILYKFIKEFDANILNFKILGGDEPVCKVIDRDEYQTLSEFGLGLKHFISIICSLYTCKEGYLFIDEIDNGIHYSQLDKLWKIILTISKEQNVQIFASTHSKESIESYARVSKKLEDKDISYIKLSRLSDGSIKSGIRDYDMIQNSIDEDHEVRG